MKRYRKQVIALLLVLPAFLYGQNSDPVLDSLKRPLTPGASVHAQLERLISILDYPNMETFLDTVNYPQQLDSLCRCCVAVKTGDKHF